MNTSEVHTRRRRPVLAAFLSSFVLLAACGGPESGGESPAAAEPLTKVTFNMGWLPQGSMAGVIVAIDKGFYRELALEVEAVRGFGGIRTVNEIDQGMFEFGYGDPLAVILNRVKGGKTKMIGAINDRWPAALCYVTSRHKINSPQDLVGLTIGGGQTSPMQVIVPQWLALNGVAAGDVEVMQLDPSIVVNSLVEGQIDAGECWKGNSLAIFQKRAASAGLEIASLEYSAFGLNIYGNGIVTSETIIDTKPELAEKFLAATYRGYAWAEANRAEATRIVVEHYPVLDPDITRQQIDELADLMDGPGSRGWIEEAKVAETLEFLSRAYDVQSAIAVGDIYTTQFLQAESAGGE
jgi:NitT/TauT family transport system substrate-binding protein